MELMSALIVYVPVLGIGITMLVFIIKLMRRGIVALDKYIEENS